MKIWEKTDRGMVRPVNQDYVLTTLYPEDNRAILVVCDGMGGANAGNVASRMAAEHIHERLQAALRSRMSAAYMKELLDAAVREANELVYNASLSDSACEGMGTTVVALIADGERGMLANVGDSRAYLINDDGIRRLTRDHSLVEEMLERGEITREEAKVYPARNLITRAVGTEADVECDIFEVPLFADEYILICTDGLTNSVDEQEILFEVNNFEDVDSCCDRLIEIAMQRGAPDNLSVVLLKI
ncbi:MAG: Stp1/IreP family PP2C-type Ser/Thr phosphatase [Clostridia bacterium]|nr:Stp1/IreP family PP2C-type Ser/Thr phosphatase [Clostridia bacterium]